MSRHRTSAGERAPALHNCGPTPHEVMRTARIGTHYHVRPHVAAGLWLRTRIGGVFGLERLHGREDAIFFLQLLTHEVHRTLGAEAPEGVGALEARTDDFAQRWAEALHRLLARYKVLTPFIGWVERRDAPTGVVDVPRDVWPPADPRVGTTPGKQALAAALAVLTPMVAVPPILAWRRPPDVRAFLDQPNAVLILHELRPSDDLAPGGDDARR